jgi:hypothetical protein
VKKFTGGMPTSRWDWGFAERQPKGSGQGNLALVEIPQESEEAGVECALGAIASFVLAERDGATREFGLQLNLSVLFEKCAREECLFHSFADNDTAVAAHLGSAMLTKGTGKLGRLTVVDDQTRIIPGRYAGAKKRAMQEDGLQGFAGDAKRACMGRMQVTDAHDLGPVAMNLRVNAPLKRDQTTRMFNDRTIDVEKEYVFRTHCALLGARAWTYETLVGSGDADRDVSKHADETLMI